MIFCLRLRSLIFTSPCADWDPSLAHLPFGLLVGAGLGWGESAPAEDLRDHSLLLRLPARSRGVGLEDRDLEAWMYLSRKWSSQEEVERAEPGILGGEDVDSVLVEW